MMAFLAAKFRHEETLRTFGVTFTGGQLPSARTADTLVSAGTAAGHTAQITFGARTYVAIISKKSHKFVHINIKAIVR